MLINQNRDLVASDHIPSRLSARGFPARSKRSTFSCAYHEVTGAHVELNLVYGLLFYLWLWLFTIYPKIPDFGQNVNGRTILARPTERVSK